MADRFASFAELAVVFAEDRDFCRHVRHGAADVAVIAPHGGNIEPGTMELATAIAGSDFSFYAFEARIAHAFENMHITSSRFDDSVCLALIADCDRVIAVHGLAEPSRRVLIGGRDNRLRDLVSEALLAAGFDAAVVARGAYSATHANNICNRGKRRAGVQIELGRHLRDELCDVAESRDALAEAIRSAVFGVI